MLSDPKADSAALAGIGEQMGIDVWEVIEAAATKPFGFMPFKPGPGLGGHCIPVDPYYLTWRALEFGISTQFIELAGRINDAMPEHVVQTLARALDAQQGRGLTGSRILVLGVAYKKNVDDVRNSPALRLMSLIEARGGHVQYHDPFETSLDHCYTPGELAGRRSLPLTRQALAEHDAVIVATDHDGVDFDLVVQAARLVVDTRNACAHRRSASTMVVKA